MVGDSTIKWRECTVWIFTFCKRERSVMNIVFGPKTKMRQKTKTRLKNYFIYRSCLQFRPDENQFSFYVAFTACAVSSMRFETNALSYLKGHWRMEINKERGIEIKKSKRTRITFGICATPLLNLYLRKRLHYVIYLRNSNR